jgi:hypothetical protein
MRPSMGGVARNSDIFSRLKVFISFAVSQAGMLTPPISMPLCGVA